MSSRKKGKGKAAGATSGQQQQQTESSAEKTEEVRGGDEGGEREAERERLEGRGGGLKAFVKQMEGSSHRVIEMRLAVVGACGVAFRVLLYDDLTGRDQAVWSVLSLIVGEATSLVSTSSWSTHLPSFSLSLSQSPFWC